MGWARSVLSGDATLDEVPEDVRQNSEVVYSAFRCFLQQYDRSIYSGVFIDDDDSLVYPMTLQDPSVFRRLIDESLLRPRDVQWASEEIRGDRDAMLAAIEKDATSFAFASEVLLANRSFVLAAVQRKGECFRCVSEDMQSNLQIAKAAVWQDGVMLDYVRGEARYNHKLLRAAKAWWWRSNRAKSVGIRNAPEDIRADKKVMLWWIERYPLYLQFASEALRAARDVVLAAVRQNGEALQFASESLRADSELVLAACQEDLHAMAHASKALCEDVDFNVTVLRHWLSRCFRRRCRFYMDGRWHWNGCWHARNLDRRCYRCYSESRWDESSEWMDCYEMDLEEEFIAKQRCVAHPSARGRRRRAARR